MVPLVDVALATVPIGDGGAASGTFGTFQQIGAAVGVAISGTVFFGAVGTDWSLPTVSQALERSGWVAITGYLIAAVASLLLPGRAAVQAHIEEQARLAAADVEAPTAAVVSAAATDASAERCCSAGHAGEDAATASVTEDCCVDETGLRNVGADGLQVCGACGGIGTAVVGDEQPSTGTRAARSAASSGAAVVVQKTLTLTPNAASNGPASRSASVDRATVSRPAAMCAALRSVVRAIAVALRSMRAACRWSASRRPVPRRHLGRNRIRESARSVAGQGLYRPAAADGDHGHRDTEQRAADTPRSAATTP